ncbi:hypothetical protein L2E82_36483 [Cichorium intybus]|uniref:Uncharacterized protein n=1 Tax=Cichorium intybus TaxID=13427 RepID=A0ACB9BRM2_CICIN|nr:hypothetical protein L2E82_36483 [Cichorium intybus]
MIYLFFAVLLVEMLTILLLLFKTPLRKLLIIGLDRAKRGRASLVVKSVTATFFVMMMYNVYSVMEIKRRPADVNNPTDQIILAYHMLEASLMVARAVFEDTPTTIFLTDYVATRWYRAPELCGSFSSKYTLAVDIWGI